jgi:hypothetical protein
MTKRPLTGRSTVFSDLTLEKQRRPENFGLKPAVIAVTATFRNLRRLHVATFRRSRQWPITPALAQTAFPNRTGQLLEALGVLDNFGRADERTLNRSAWFDQFSAVTLRYLFFCADPIRTFFVTVRFDQARTPTRDLLQLVDLDEANPYASVFSGKDGSEGTRRQ